jgi:NAD-dependent deacetylase
MSADSGVATFRTSADGTPSGYWEGLRGKLALAAFGIPAGWSWFPETAWIKYLEEFYSPIANAAPNPGHFALAELEKIVTKEGKEFDIVTMNVDGYHQRAGNTKVSEVHGTVTRHRCVKNGHPMDISQEYLSNFSKKPIPKCAICNSTPRPDCVLFTESLPEDQWIEADRVSRRLKSRDVMIVIGTSSVVYPAASLPEIAAASGATIIECNLYPSDFT